jgi:hypothetical protein
VPLYGPCTYDGAGQGSLSGLWPFFLSFSSLAYAARATAGATSSVGACATTRTSSAPACPDIQKWACATSGRQEIQERLSFSAKASMYGSKKRTGALKSPGRLDRDVTEHYGFEPALSQKWSQLVTAVFNCFSSFGLPVCDPVWPLAFCFWIF